MLSNNMGVSKSSVKIQLREAAQLTGACWAVWLECAADWEILATYQLNVQRRAAILDYVRQPNVVGWLKSALAGKRCRPRSIPPTIGIPGSKMFVFSDQMTQRLILVGAEQLPEVSQRFWRSVSLGNASQPLLDSGTVPLLANVDLGIPYHLPHALDRILELVLWSAASEAGWLAVRSGDYFEIGAHAGCGDCSGMRIAIEVNPLMREIVRTRRAKVVEKDEPYWARVPQGELKKPAHLWAALPLVIGQRLIGLIAFWRDLPVASDEWAKLQQLAGRIAP
jgi:hypothetical protein